ncbi:MAG: hypothetical protein JST75_12105 [Bacteroidetes bacterium]|nr:hypothetical protein [Bacteroidota bacterium]
MQLIFYGIFLFLAVFTAGIITALHIQHYSIYNLVGKEHFKDYMRANNKAGIISSLIPSILLILVNFILVFSRPAFMTITETIFCLILNIIGLTSTLIGQRKIQTEMEETGYNEERISFLISTNWIRIFLYFTVALMAVIFIVIGVS